MKQTKEKQMSKEKTNRDLELELLQEKLKNLEQRVTKPKNSQEEYEERLAKYDANKDKREALKQVINQRRMELQQQNPKAKWAEIEIIEAWERRSEELKATDPAGSQMFKNQIKRKLKEINSDPFRG